MWKETLNGKVHIKETPLITLRVKVLGASVVGEVCYNGNTEIVYRGASWYEAKGACDDRAIELLRQSRESILK